MSTKSAVICTSALHKYRSVRPSSCLWRRYVQQRWLKLIVGIGVLMILLNCLAIGYGRMQRLPNAASAIGLSLCGDSPCYKHLVPGRTRWAAALAQYKDTFDDPTYPYHPVMSPSLDGKRLATIAIALDPAANVTAGDIVQLYGVPCRVDIFTSGTSMMLTYPSLEVQLNLTRRYFNPDTPVYRVFLYGSGDDAFDTQANPCSLDVLNSIQAATSVRRSWRGYTSIHHYLFP
jgi:hypothetical protein